VLARTLTEAFNAAYEIAETRPRWKRFALCCVFGPILALVVIVSVGLMLIEPRLLERIAEVVVLDEIFVTLWGWLRFPVALSLLGAEVNAMIYHALLDGMMETEVPNPEHESSNGPDKRVRDA